MRKARVPTPIRITRTICLAGSPWSSQVRLSNIFGWLVGIEPTTFWTTIRHSDQLNYSHHINKNHLGIWTTSKNLPQNLFLTISKLRYDSLLWASNENRTHIFSLEGCSTNHCAILAYDPTTLFYNYPRESNNLLRKRCGTCTWCGCIINHI